jgi:hypothetical protein
MTIADNEEQVLAELCFESRTFSGSDVVEEANLSFGLDRLSNSRTSPNRCRYEKKKRKDMVFRICENNKSFPLDMIQSLEPRNLCSHIYLHSRQKPLLVVYGAAEGGESFANHT